MKKMIPLYLLFSSAAYSATVEFSEELIPLQVNQQKVEHSFFSSVDKIELPAGQHHVKVKYKDLYEIDYDEHETIESKPFWLVISIDKPEATYSLAMPRPDDIEKARQYVDSPFATFKLSGTAANPVKLLPIAAPNLSHAPQKVTAEQSELAVADTTKTREPESTTHTVDQKASSEQSPSAFSMLEFWWAQATPEQREMFLKNKKGS